MKKILKKMILLSLVLVLLVGCAGEPKRTGIKPVKEVKTMELSHEGLKNTKAQRFEIPESFEKNLRDFSIEISSKYFSENSSKNALISPISIRYAFSTLSEGAGTKTAELFSKFIHETLDQAFSENNKIHKTFLNTAMNSEERSSKIVVKDSLWIDDSLTLKKDFIDKAANYHFAEVFNADLGDQKTADAINQWVKDATNNLIDPKKGPDSQLKLLILNTIYFKEAWSKPFDKSLNTKEDFTLSNGEKKQVEFMHLFDAFREIEEQDDYYIAQLNFSGGSVFRVLLPKEGKDLNELMKNQSQGKLIDSLLNATLPDTAHIKWQVPKFTFQSEIDLKGLMSSMGYEELFSTNADFSNVSDTKLYISDARQLTNFILNNEGVEAAAYTEIAMKEAAAAPMEEPREIEITLNKPFLYTILLWDGTPLFIGMMNDPA